MGVAESSSMDMWGWDGMGCGNHCHGELIHRNTSKWAWGLEIALLRVLPTLKYDIIWHSLWHPFWRSRIPSDIYSDCLAFSAMCSGPGVPSPRWGPAVPTEIWSSQLKQSRLIKSRDPHLGRWGHILQVMGISHDCWRFSIIIHKSYINHTYFPWIFRFSLRIFPCFSTKTPRNPERRSKSWQICVGPAAISQFQPGENYGGFTIKDWRYWSFTWLNQWTSWLWNLWSKLSWGYNRRIPSQLSIWTRESRPFGLRGSQARPSTSWWESTTGRPDNRCGRVSMGVAPVIIHFDGLFH